MSSSNFCTSYQTEILTVGQEIFDVNKKHKLRIFDVYALSIWLQGISLWILIPYGKQNFFCNPGGIINFFPFPISCEHHTAQVIATENYFLGIS